jgi:hypothetical protein
MEHNVLSGSVDVVSAKGMTQERHREQIMLLEYPLHMNMHHVCTYYTYPRVQNLANRANCSAPMTYSAKGSYGAVSSRWHLEKLNPADQAWDKSGF